MEYAVLGYCAYMLGFMAVAVVWAIPAWIDIVRGFCG